MAKRNIDVPTEEAPAPLPPMMTERLEILEQSLANLSRKLELHLDDEPILIGLLEGLLGMPPGWLVNSIRERRRQPVPGNPGA